MRKYISYRIITIGLSFGFGMGMFAGAASAQQAPRVLPEADIYCSGMVTDQPVPRETYVISGENSDYKIVFAQGDPVYINRGADQGVKIGDVFQVIRPVHDMDSVKWFKYQPQLMQAMGTTYADIGRMRVIQVQPKTSTAKVSLSCDAMQRGDIVQPFQPRPSPALHNVKFDPFAPPSGNKTGMVVTTKDFGMLSGAGRIVYINLGSAQGIQVGNYFRMFRYQGSRNDSVYQEKDTAYKVYGFGSAPVAYQWDNLPRQVVGEGIVLRTGPNSSTVLLTDTRIGVFVGDYVELE